MEIKTFQNSGFSRYARVVEGYELAGFVKHFREVTEMPAVGYTYTASIPELESHSIFAELGRGFFGGLPIQLGCCNGTNTVLDSVEYHKCSEICITAEDTIFILGSAEDMTEWRYDTACLEAFLVPGGTMIEIKPYTLHYAPCDGEMGLGFRVAVALVQGTCSELLPRKSWSGEDELLVSVNKWLLCHPQAKHPEPGAPLRLQGAIIDITRDIKLH